jgi:hypothetical protein
VSTQEPVSIEDRVRTATRAGATLVRDIGPMAAEPEKVRSRRPAPLARRWGTWGIPLAAAAAVVLVALSLVAVRQFGASAPTSSAPATNAPATSAPAAVPRYYVALGEDATSYFGFRALIVGDDHTGKAIATVSTPHGMVFEGVQGASDDRTFVVMATSQTTHGAPPDTWYLLRIAPGTAHPYQLAKLPIKLPSSSPTGTAYPRPSGSPAATAYALSPDDRELAVESFSVSGNVTTLALYSVSSGAELRAWTTSSGAYDPAQPTLSWLPDGRQLAFSHLLSDGAGLQNQLRTLDVTASGTDLITTSRVLLTRPVQGPADCWTMQLTPDGGTVICGSQYAMYDTGPVTNADCANGGLEFTAYSVGTGKPLRVLYRRRGACHDGLTSVLWTDSAAKDVIGVTDIDELNQGGKQTDQLGVIAGGHIRLLTLPKSVSPADYGNIAF